MVVLEKHASQIHNPLIKKGDFGFVFALVIDIVWASLAQDVATCGDLQNLLGVSYESRHILNESLAVAFPLEKQGAQGMVRA